MLLQITEDSSGKTVYVAVEQIQYIDANGGGKATIFVAAGFSYTATETAAQVVARLQTAGISIIT